MKRALIAWLLLAPFAAHAQLETDDTEHHHSPQHFAFELKFGPYSPDIDSTPGLTGKPFSELFNAQDGDNFGKRPPGKLLTSVELDWQIWHGFGSVGLGASVGYSRRTTHEFVYPVNANGMMLMNADGTPKPCMVNPNLNLGCLRSADVTALNVMPFALEAVYRFDWLALHYSIPLVPYLKGGIAYYLWWVENGSGAISMFPPTNPTDSGRGGTFGLVAHPGIALLLDALEQDAARTMDTELGINHTYLFFEMHYAWITGFGSSSKMVLSDLTWNAGMAFEF